MRFFCFKGSTALPKYAIGKGTLVGSAYQLIFTGIDY
jgi:hypothetical protein